MRRADARAPSATSAAATGAPLTRASISFSRGANSASSGPNSQDRGRISPALTAPAQGTGGRGAGQHRGHRLRELGPHGGVAVEEVGEPGQHHQARHPLGERCPGVGLHRRGRPPGVAQALLRRQADRGVLAIARGDAVDGDPRVRDQPLERGAARRHPLQRFGCHLDRGTQPAHPFGGGERDVVAAAQDRVGTAFRAGLLADEHGG